MKNGPAEQAGNRPSICFIAQNALGALTGKNQTHVGGIERQQATMAKWLSRNGWDVTMIVWGESGPVADRIHGVRILMLCERDAGLPGLRFVYPRWTSLRAALACAAADIFYYNCGDLVLGQIVLWARSHGKQVIFSVPSDPDCDPELPALNNLREKILYRFGLRHCDHIVVQSEKQRQMLLEGFSRDSKRLSMPCRGFLSNTQRRSDTVSPFRVLWVGRISVEKRVEWLIEIAGKMPDVEFVVVGAPNLRSEYADGVLDAGQALPNIQLAGRVPYESMDGYYHSADVLCCTSKYEGFPNVFIEAWSAGLPVVSTCDPDGLIEKHTLGRHVLDVEGAVDAIARLSNDTQYHRRTSAAAVAYFSRYHDLDTAMQYFEEYFRSLRCSFQSEEVRP